jgi:oxygen-independent coproporphyrinogen III oxidase
VIHPPPELLERHGLPGPRYTSYPSAMHWGAAPPADAWLAALDRALARHSARVGLYVHIPFCASLCTFCGCNMRVARSHALAAPYMDHVLKEYALYRRRLAPSSLALGGLYLGGGTPTWLPLEELNRLLDALLTDTTVAEDADFAIEADPRNTTREQLALLYRHGFRRITIGVQDFDTRVLQIVNRPQSEAEVRRTVNDARELGFSSVGVDFIHGLPLQTTDSLRASLTILMRLRPDYVNFLPYAHVPWIKPSQRLFTESDLPDAQLRRELNLLGREKLGAAGYVEIGIDQYALPEDPLAKALAAGTLARSFMGFSARPVDALIGLGVSAIGAAPSMYAQNEKNLQRYETRLAAGELPLQRGHVLQGEDLAIRDLLTDLLAGRSAHLPEQLRREPWWPEVVEALQPLVRDGLLALSDGHIAATELGRAFLPRIGIAFDRYLKQLKAA